MVGSVRHTGNGPAIPAAHRCSIASCRRRAVASCFECERCCCERHLSAVSLVMGAGASSIRVRVCPACLHRYRIDPEIEPLLTDIVTWRPTD